MVKEVGKTSGLLHSGIPWWCTVTLHKKFSTYFPMKWRSTEKGLHTNLEHSSFCFLGSRTQKLPYFISIMNISQTTFSVRNCQLQQDVSPVSISWNEGIPPTPGSHVDPSQSLSAFNFFATFLVRARKPCGDRRIRGKLDTRTNYQGFWMTLQGINSPKHFGCLSQPKFEGQARKKAV